jgi:uncharacterized membrane protein YhaH (DUF805 family)
MGQSFYASSKGRLLFGLRGRIPRTDFWVGLSIVAVITALGILIGGHGVRGGTLGQFFTLVKVIAALSPVCLIAIAVKRLHDLDKPGWYVLSFVVLPLLLAAFAGLVGWTLQNGSIVEEARLPWTIVFYVVMIVAGTLFARFIATLGFVRGTQGSNRFGPDPLVVGTAPVLDAN